MDDHFQRVLAGARGGERKDDGGAMPPPPSRAAASAPFVPAGKFGGAKAGYVFKNDGQGTGYYRDLPDSHKPAAPEPSGEDEDDEEMAGRVQLACDLLRLADHFQLDELRQRCECFLSQQSVIGVLNVCGLLVHAHGCNAHQLMEMCRFYIVSMRDLVTATEDWRALPDDIKQMVG